MDIQLDYKKSAPNVLPGFTVNYTNGYTLESVVASSGYSPRKRGIESVITKHHTNGQAVPMLMVFLLKPISSEGKYSSQFVFFLRTMKSKTQDVYELIGVVVPEEGTTIVNSGQFDANTYTATLQKEKNTVTYLFTASAVTKNDKRLYYKKESEPDNLLEFSETTEIVEVDKPTSSAVMSPVVNIHDADEEQLLQLQASIARELSVRSMKRFCESTATDPSTPNQITKVATLLLEELNDVNSNVPFEFIQKLQSAIQS